MRGRVEALVGHGTSIELREERAEPVRMLVINRAVFIEQSLIVALGAAVLGHRLERAPVPLRTIKIR